MLQRLRSAWGSLWNSRFIYPLVAALSAFSIFVVLPLIQARPRAAPALNLPVIHNNGVAGPEMMGLAEHRGKVVLLDFWATWCGPCRALSPTLRELGHRYAGRGLVVIGVNVDEDGPSHVPMFTRALQLDYPQLAAQPGTQRDWEVRFLPTTVLIDRAGMIRRVSTGNESEASLAAEIEKYL